MLWRSDFSVLRYIICEDNASFLQKISEVVNKMMMPYEFSYKLNKFQGYKPEIEDIIKNKDEHKIYILDVEMPEVSGLEIASMIRENDSDSTIIFLTSYPEYRNDVFYSRLLALDYIQKGALWNDRLEDTLKYTLKLLNRNQTLKFNYNGSSYRIELKDINYIEKVQDFKKCVIYTKDGKQYQMTNTLKKLEAELGPLFYKCHKSFIVNTENIKYINYPDNSITFKNNQSEYLISNRCKKGLKEYVEKY